ncbi:MAG: large subunit ribosomal protein L24 [Parcubacteria group bacterium Athens0714_25]|nr:MAG: large subunit ribosomal protein L24 [Parcubacteria group bacterium Athens0714_25]
MKIKKGDKVQIISGKDKGKKGVVLRAVPSLGKVVVEGLNIVKKHSRPKKEGEKGQRVEIPVPIQISNVMLVCPKCGKSTRVEYKLTDDSKLRICKKCKEEIQ